MKSSAVLAKQSLLSGLAFPSGFDRPHDLP